MATLREAYDIALKHQNSGRLQAAEQIYRNILAVDPNQADAIHLLGLIAYHSGKYDAAIECIGRAIRLRENTPLFHNNLGEVYRAARQLDAAVASCRRAVELNPQFAEAHYNLANALKEQGKLDDAIASYRQAVELKPGMAEAHNNLGAAFWEQRNLEAAVACYRRALEVKPGYAEAHANLGIALNDQGMLEEAAARYRRALELKPGHADAHNNLGVILRDQGKMDEAIACFRRSLELQPNFAGALNNLGAILREQGKLDEAIACYRRALELKPDFAGAHNNLGVAFRDQGMPEKAVACYHRALELKPSFAEAHSNLGRDLLETGDFHGAEQSFRTALRLDPRFTYAHHSLAELLGSKLPDDDLAAQLRLLETAELPDLPRMLLHFGLAQVMDARGEYAKAAEHANMANDLRLKTWQIAGQGYDPQAHSTFVGRIIADFTPEFFARVAEFGAQSERPVFIVGLPRSGTTLVEQILGSHSQIFGAGELPLARDAFAALCNSGMMPGTQLAMLDGQSIPRLAAQHLQELQRRNETALRVADKMPDNTFYLGFLAALFPRARFIHCRRDLRDVAVSCWITNFRDIRWASDVGHIAGRFREYRRLMEHWRQVLPAPLLEVSYEETVADVETAARRLVEWCGLEWEPACLDFHRAKRPVRTASAVQVRQAVFSKSVGRWKHYEQSLAALLSAIGDDS